MFCTVGNSKKGKVPRARSFGSHKKIVSDHGEANAYSGCAKPMLLVRSSDAETECNYEDGAVWPLAVGVPVRCLFSGNYLSWGERWRDEPHGVAIRVTEQTWLTQWWWRTLCVWVGYSASNCVRSANRHTKGFTGACASGARIVNLNLSNDVKAPVLRIFIVKCVFFWGRKQAYAKEGKDES